MSIKNDNYVKLVAPFVKDYYGDGDIANGVPGVNDMPGSDGVRKAIVEWVSKEWDDVLDNGLNDYEPDEWLRFCCVVLTKADLIDWAKVQEWVETEYEKEKENSDDESDDESDEE
jgi:hypothetical protein